MPLKGVKASAHVSSWQRVSAVQSLADLMLDGRTTQRTLIKSLGRYAQARKPAGAGYAYVFSLKGGLFESGDVRDVQRHSGGPPDVRLWLGLQVQDRDPLFVGDLARAFGKPVLLYREDAEPAAMWVYRRKGAPWMAVILGGLSAPDASFPFKLTGAYPAYSVQIIVKKASWPLPHFTQDIQY